MTQLLDSCIDGWIECEAKGEYWTVQKNSLYTVCAFLLFLLLGQKWEAEEEGVNGEGEGPKKKKPLHMRIAEWG